MAFLELTSPVADILAAVNELQASNQSLGHSAVATASLDITGYLSLIILW
jgi:hypothetical protein